MSGYPKETIGELQDRIRELEAEVERLRKVHHDIDGARLMLLDQRDTAVRLLRNIVDGWVADACAATDAAIEAAEQWLAEREAAG